MSFEALGLVRISVANTVDEEDSLRRDLVGERVTSTVCDVRFTSAIWEIEETVDRCSCKVLLLQGEDIKADVNASDDDLELIVFDLVGTIVL